jgi:hypothetical protein
MRRSLSVALYLLLGAGLLLLALWFFDPPVSAGIIQGTVVASTEPNHGRPLYYRTTLMVRTDDGRLVMALSERRELPPPGQHVIMQERVGLFGTRKYVEVPGGEP